VLLSLVAFFVVALTSATAQALPQHVDRIFINGKIWTADDTRPKAEALAVSGDKIVAVGSTKEIGRSLGRHRRGRPQGSPYGSGFQDSHLHFPGASVNEVDLVGVESLRNFSGGWRAFEKYILHCHGSRAMVGVIQRFPIKRSTRNTSTR